MDILPKDNIIYFDESVAVAVKPAGVVSEEDGEGSMPELLRKELGGSVYPVHRLDAPVSGIMVYARTEKAAAGLSEQIRNGSMKKEYHAVVHGLTENGGTLEDYLFKSREGKVFVVKSLRKGVKKASLEYETLKKCIIEPEKAEASLVHITLKTGRTHQIRVQFASRKHPLFGDRKYGASDSCKKIMLFSSAVTFAHPKTGREMHFEAPLPEPFSNMISNIIS